MSSLFERADRKLAKVSVSLLEAAMRQSAESIGSAVRTKDTSVKKDNQEHLSQPEENYFGKHSDHNIFMNTVSMAKR